MRARWRWSTVLGGLLPLVLGLASVSCGPRPTSAVRARVAPAAAHRGGPPAVRALLLLQTRLPAPTAPALQAERVVLLRRLHRSGIAPAQVLLRPPRQIAVVVPAGRRIPRPFLSALLTETGVVTLQDSKAVALSPGSAIPAARYPILARNADITANATWMGRDPFGQWVVRFTLHGPAAGRVAASTAAQRGRYLAVALDGRVLVDPQITSALSSAQFQVVFVAQPHQSGPGPDPDPLVQAQERAQEFFVAVTDGPLPLPVQALAPPQAVS